MEKKRNKKSDVFARKQNFIRNQMQSMQFRCGKTSITNSYRFSLSTAFNVHTTIVQNGIVLNTGNTRPLEDLKMKRS